MTHSDFRWRTQFIPAYGPSLLFGFSNGAVLPVIALAAMDLGASAAMAGLIVTLIGLGSLAGNIPAAMVTARFGERRSLIGASLLSIVAFLLCLLATGPAVLALGMVLFGLATSVFFLARQTYLIEMVPVALRARALAMLGGVHRIGMFGGPFAAAAAISAFGLAGAFYVSIATLAVIGMLCFTMPDLRASTPQSQPDGPRPSVAAIARTHRNVFLTLGVGALSVAAMRASRQIVIPLWAAGIGLSPATTAVLFGLVSAIDMLIFYPAGKIMDIHGRLWVALPCALLLGISFMLIPLTHSLAAFTAVCLLMGFANGIGSGLVMTLGADASPAVGRTQFLGVWRLIADIGNSAGPFCLSGLTAIASLGTGIAATGLFGITAAVLFWHFLPRQH